MKILSAELYYSACWQDGRYILVETPDGYLLMSLAEYEAIPNRPRVKLVEVAA